MQAKRFGLPHPNWDPMTLPKRSYHATLPIWAIKSRFNSQGWSKIWSQNLSCLKKTENIIVKHISFFEYSGKAPIHLKFWFSFKFKNLDQTCALDLDRMAHICKVTWWLLLVKSLDLSHPPIHSCSLHVHLVSCQENCVCENKAHSCRWSAKPASRYRTKLPPTLRYGRADY
jgi:hypothetical protein